MSTDLTWTAEMTAFLRESLRIEGIIRAPTQREKDATLTFWRLSGLTSADIVALVKVYRPNAVLRDRDWLNVRVGDHVAPRGGQAVVDTLDDILARATVGDDPWRVHCDYETLHPFTDGNGRSGRALWAWQMLRRQRGLPLGFLHQWYYQTLAASR